MIKTNIEYSSNQIVGPVARQFILTFMEIFSVEMMKMQVSNIELIGKFPTLLGKSLAKQKLIFPIVPPLAAKFN